MYPAERTCTVAVVHWLVDFYRGASPVLRKRQLVCAPPRRRPCMKFGKKPWFAAECRFSIIFLPCTLDTPLHRLMRSLYSEQGIWTFCRIITIEVFGKSQNAPKRGRIQSAEGEAFNGRPGRDAQHAWHNNELDRQYFNRVTKLLS